MIWSLFYKDVWCYQGFYDWCLFQTNNERLAVEQRLAELRVQHDGLQELIATLKDARGAAKVVEWQAKMESVRLEDLRLKRDIDRLKMQVNSKTAKCDISFLLIHLSSCILFF